MPFYQNPHAPGCPWHDVTVMHGAANIKWCEETLCSWISEPANTWSNLGYMVVGFFIFAMALRDNQSWKLKQFGPIVFFMGLMSFVFHLSNFYTTQILDYWGMFLFVGWVLGMNLIRLGKIKEKNLMAFNLSLLGVYTAIVHIMYLAGLKYQMLILISGFLIIFTEILCRRRERTSFRFFVVACAFLIAAFTFSILDGKRIWCHPTEHGWFSQGHAVWHWLSAVAMWFIYKHYSLLSRKEQHN